MNNTTPWVEKYRPINFESIVLDNINKQIFNNILNKNYFPNLLFYGPPGTGKTTTIINLINEYQKKYFKVDKSLVIHLNASDERGIDIVRNQIHTFVKSHNLFENGLKFVILDEVDYMTKNAQQAFKYLLQSCGSNVKFCLICNYISKVEYALQNEFICIRFNQLPRKDIYNFINIISKKENLSLSKDTINAIQDIYNSDIRSIINFIQLNQNLDLNKWKDRVLNNDIFENIHKKMGKEENDLYSYINDISLKFNIGIKSLIQRYFDYLIRNKKTLINKELLDLIKGITHCEDVKNEEILNYFCNNFREYFSNLNSI